MKVTVYECDRCGKNVREDEVTHVEFNHGRGTKFSLSDETFEMCSACAGVIILAIKEKRT